MKGYIKPKVNNPALDKIIRMRNQEKEKNDLLIRNVNSLKPVIDSTFVSFKNFMHWSTKCTYQLKQINMQSLGKMYARIIPQFFSAGEAHIYTLEIDSLSLSLPEHFNRSIFFHEFTHLYDLEQTKLIKIRKDGYTRAFSFITEAHASEIELMYQLGFGSIGSKMELTLESKLSNVNRSPTILEYLNQKYQVIVNTIDTDYTKAIKHYQYYLGILKFLLCNNAFSDNQFEQITKIKLICDRFCDSNMIIANSIFTGKYDKQTIQTIEDEINRIKLRLIVKGIKDTFFTSL